MTEICVKDMELDGELTEAAVTDLKTALRIIPTP